MYLSPQDLLPKRPAAIANWPQHFARQQTLALAPDCQHYYQQGLPDSRLTLEQVPLVALDIETTGLDSRHEQILAIGILPFQLNKLRSGDCRQWLIHGNNAMNEDNVIIHGITDAERATGLSLAQAMRELLVSIAGKILVVHYRDLEMRFLQAASEQVFQQPLSLPMIDTMAIERQLAEQTWQQHWQTMWRGQRRSLRLNDCRQRYGLPPYRPHHACSDALATAELLMAQHRHLRLNRHSWQAVSLFK